MSLSAESYVSKDVNPGYEPHIPGSINARWFEILIIIAMYLYTSIRIGPMMDVGRNLPEYVSIVHFETTTLSSMVCISRKVQHARQKHARIFETAFTGIISAQDILYVRSLEQTLVDVDLRRRQWAEHHFVDLLRKLGASQKMLRISRDQGT